MLNGAERQRRYRERLRAAVPSPAAPATPPTAVTEPITGQPVMPVRDAPSDPVTAAASSLESVTVNFSPAELRRLAQWSRCQVERPSLAEGVRMLVRQALGLPD